MESSDKARQRKIFPLPYQQRWLNDRGALKLWVASRQIGKSFALSLEAVDEALRGKCANLLLSASERQSRELMGKVMSHLRGLNIMAGTLERSPRETTEEVVLPNGSRIISLPANPATVRGFTGNVFLDEFAFHQDAREVWRAMYPTVTRGYKVRVVSTPNGKQNLFWELWDSDSRFSKHRVDIYEARRAGLDVDVEALRAGIGDPEAWAQEFECRFIDEATAYLTYELIAGCEDATLQEGIEAQEIAPESEYYAGVDVGRKRDLSVIWVVERMGDVFVTRGLREMRNEAFSVQRDVLYGLMDVLRIRRCAVDASGIGAQLAEEARQRYGARVEPVVFTAAVKEDLAVTVRRAFEDRRVRIPASAEIREDLHAVRRSVTSAGNTRFDAARSEGGHADRFWSLALALHAGATTGSEVSYERVSNRTRQRQYGCF